MFLTKRNLTDCKSGSRIGQREEREELFLGHQKPVAWAASPDFEFIKEIHCKIRKWEREKTLWQGTEAKNGYEGEEKI